MSAEAWIAMPALEKEAEAAGEAAIDNEAEAAGEADPDKKADEKAEVDETPPKNKKARGDETKQSQDEVVQWLQQCSKHLVHIEKRAMESEHLGHEVRAHGTGCCDNRGPGTKKLSASRTNPVSPPPSPCFRTRIPI